jgi:aminopeptidase N
VRTLTAEEAARRAALLDVTSYDIALDLTRDDGFTSVCEVRFSCREPGAATFLELDGEAVLVERGGRPVDVVVEGNRLLLDDLAAEEVVRVTARCDWSSTGEGLQRSTDPADGRVYLYAQAFLDDAQRVFACFDQPDLKAVFRLSITAPEDWTVLSGPRAVSAEGGRWEFAPTERLSTYHVTLAAGPWHGVRETSDGIELGVWCRQSLAEHLDADELLSITKQSFAFQQEAFGRRYPFGDSYDQVFVPDFNAGAMENPGMVTFDDDAFVFRSKVTQGRRRLRAQVVAHEMAHMWFGNLVTMRWWDGIWLNESFAELMGVFTVDRALPYDGAWADFCLARKAWGYRADQLPTTHPVDGPVTDNRAALLNFDGISYAKGASVLRQLMAWVGEDAFFAGVRAYLADHAYGSTGLVDLLDAVGHAGGRDLTDWAQVWLRTPGVSTLRPEVTTAADGTLAEVVVRQEPPAAHPVLRPHRLALGLYDLDAGQLTLRERVEVDVDGERTAVPGLTGARRPDLLLVNDGDLTFAKVRFDDVSLATVLAHLPALADPLARALCWAALWDAARDAELPAARFVEAVLAGAGGEDDPDLLATLYGQAATAATSYAPAGQVSGMLTAVTDAALALAAGQEPGGDLQLVLVRAAAQTATTDGQLDLLAAWLGGERLPAGLDVDTDLRWHLVQRLAAAGRLDAGDVAAELDRDRTAAGEQAAAYALAARPDPAAKEQAWAELTGTGPLPASRAYALADGFWQHGQDALLRPYADRYAADIPPVWERRGPQVATTVSRLLFPATLVTPDVLAATAPLLDRPDLPAGLRRVLLEQSDDLARALAARAGTPAGAV